MNYFDLTIGILLVAAFIYGLVKGLVRQLFSLAALFLGVYCAFKFSGFAGHYIARWIHTNETWTNAIAFAVTFTLVLVGVVFVGRFAERIISFAALGFFNRIFGGIFGLIKIAFILCVLLFIAESLNSNYPIFSTEKIEASFFYKPLKEISHLIFPYLHW